MTAFYRPEVVILGGGPGAVFAYYGALAAGVPAADVQIWAKDLSYPPGAFWLHALPANCPFQAEPSEILVQLLGNEEDYSRKQWGEAFPTSASAYSGKTLKAYNPHQVLPKLWAEANVRRMDTKWTPAMVELLAAEHSKVIVTFPIDQRAINEMSQLKIPVYVADTEEDTLCCIYNGIQWNSWVRLTRAFGKLNIEYPATYLDRMDLLEREENMHWGLKGKIVKVPELHPSVKTLPHNTTGYRNNILMTGRWATLNRKALSHDSWTDAYCFLTEQEVEV